MAARGLEGRRGRPYCRWAALGLVIAAAAPPAAARETAPPADAEDLPAQTQALAAQTAGLPGEPVLSAAEMDDLDLERLSQLSLEELMALEVTSVEGVGREWFFTPSALYVITHEDARRTGHLTLPELLRLAPGMFVGRGDSNTWRIGPRGFTGAAIPATKNLVLIDGRVVYDPVFSGTFWEVQDVVLEDLDRLEVIRGPGATLWGANAVNGVINVTTRSARDTQGLFLQGAAGDPHLGVATVRYGGALNEDTWFRVWGRFSSWDSFENSLGMRAHDDWSIGRMGLRLDGEGDDQVQWMVKGEVYQSFTYGEATRVPVPGAHLRFRQVIGDGRVSGGYLQFRMAQDTAEDAGWSFHTYYDRTERLQSAGTEVNRDTFDLEFRRHLGWGGRHDLIWGTQANLTTDRIDDGPTIGFSPDTDTHYTLSAFVQNTTELVADRLHGMIGTKLSYNDYTGVEVQPSARLWWTPDDRQMVWGAVSRAVRVPSRLERDGMFTLAIVDAGLLAGDPPSGTFVPVGTVGNDQLDSEVLIAYELGHRLRLTDDLTFDTALFYHDYDRLISVPPMTLGTFNNQGEGRSYGVESVVTWRVAPNWRLETSYSFVDVDHQGPILQLENGNTPRHQAQVRSYLDITHDLEFNAILYYVDALPSQGAESYLRLDLGTTWRVNEDFELAVWGQNLLDPQHPETGGTEVPRGYFVQGTLRF